MGAKKRRTRNRRDIWSLGDSVRPEPITTYSVNEHSFTQTGQMIELCSENLSLWCINYVFLSAQLFGGPW